MTTRKMRLQFVKGCTVSATFVFIHLIKELIYGFGAIFLESTIFIQSQKIASVVGLDLLTIRCIPPDFDNSGC